MKVFYFAICNKTINHKSKNRHIKTARHYFFKEYITDNYNYNDFVCGDVEKILHENIISHNNKFNEFKTFVICKINDNLEIKVYKESDRMHVGMPAFLGWNNM